MNEQYYKLNEPMKRLLAALERGDIDQHVGPDLYAVRDRLEELNVLYLAVEDYLRTGFTTEWASVINQYEKSANLKTSKI